VYEALLQPGEKVLALDLRHGGHLSHGSPVNITGRRQQIINYHVNDETELLDYEEIYETAMREKPKMMIAGYTSYPWAPDFKRFREIADACGSILLADISHTAGMAAVGAYPNPVGIAHVTSFTTHKTLFGPRGAVIITTDPELAKKIDRAVFPGMQGGPFMHKVAATATMFKLAQTPQFRELQFQTAKNAVALSEGFKANGLRVVHGGTNTHMVLLDCKSAAKNGDVPLMGDTASRILELANIVCNRNTIPGDPDAGKPSALRFGTPWITQRGLRENDMREIAATVALVLKSAKPYAVQLKKSVAYRARVDFDALIEGARRMSQLAQKAGVDVSVPTDGYPHMWEKVSTVKSEWQALEIAGHEVTNFLNAVLAEGVADLGAGERKQTQLLGRNRVPLCEATVVNTGTQFVLGVPSAHYERAAQWLRALSDGFVIFDDADVAHGVPGPVTVTEFGAFKA
jgi:glycine hydroxymethyltransferase